MSGAARDVIGVGANSVDHVLRIPVTTASLISSGKVRITERHVCAGGQTATAISACAALGLRTSYIGAFGSDEHGSRIRTELRTRGVDVSHAVECDAPNAGAVILVDRTGRRTVLWERDQRLSQAPLEIRSDLLRVARLIHVDDVDPPVALQVSRQARELGIPVTSDLEQVSDGTEQLAASVTYPIFDHNAPEILTAERDPERALRKLRRLNPGLLCMTLGDQGAAALEGDQFHLVPAVNVPVVDATGAGDVFRAGFIYGLLQGWGVPQILRFANAAAALSCTKLGAIASVPSVQEVSALYHRGHGEKTEEKS